MRSIDFLSDATKPCVSTLCEQAAQRKGDKLGLDASMYPPQKTGNTRAERESAKSVEFSLELSIAT